MGSRVATRKSPPRAAYDIFDEDFDADSPEKPASSMQYSSRTASLLAELDNNRGRGRAAMSATITTTKGSKSTKTTSKAKTALPLLSSIEDPSSQTMPPPAKRKNRLTTPEREQKAKDKTKEKEAAAAERAAVRAAKQKEKQLAADLAEVNKSRHDKKHTVGEMIVKMPEKLFEKNAGRLAEDVLQQVGVQVEMDSIRIPADAGDVMTWQRKVRSTFDEEKGHWVPTGRMEICDETSHILSILEGSVLVRMVQRDTAQADATAGNTDGVGAQDSTDTGLSLNAHARLLKRRWPAARPIYLVEGLETYMRKSKNARNRSYQAAVRAQDEVQDAPTGTQNKRKRKPKDDVIVDDEAIEDALLQLQVEHNCLIHHTSSAPETAEWIGNFTEQISSIRYKLVQSATDASFCMDNGQVRTGEDKEDTYVKMLQEIVRVTLPVAYGVVAKYPTVVGLVRAMRQHGPLLLEDLKKCSNKNGAFTDARIGPAISKRIYKIFMGTDPDSMDV